MTWIFSQQRVQLKQNYLQSKPTLPSILPPQNGYTAAALPTYVPHSNECGPRCLLALIVIVLHPDPSPSILLPLMQQNIVQISHTWIAKTIVTNFFDPAYYLVSSNHHAPLLLPPVTFSHHPNEYYQLVHQAAALAQPRQKASVVHRCIRCSTRPLLHDYLQSKITSFLTKAPLITFPIHNIFPSYHSMKLHAPTNSQASSMVIPYTTVHIPSETLSSPPSKHTKQANKQQSSKAMGPNSRTTGKASDHAKQLPQLWVTQFLPQQSEISCPIIDSFGHELMSIDCIDTLWLILWNPNCVKLNLLGIGEFCLQSAHLSHTWSRESQPVRN